MVEKIRYAGWISPGLANIRKNERHKAHEGDRKLDRPRRPCSRCGKRFQPTIKRRMLCAYCFENADEWMT